jgi:uncharacterized protein
MNHHSSIRRRLAGLTRAPSASLVLSLTCLPVGQVLAGAASFDCAQAKTAAERMVCDDWHLGQLDARLATLLERALQAGTADPDAVQAAQRDWLEGRDTCTDPACLEQAYRTRIGALGGGAAGNAGELAREIVDDGRAVHLADQRPDLDVEALYPLLPAEDAALAAANAAIADAYTGIVEGLREQYADFLAAEGGVHLGPPWALSLGYQSVNQIDEVIAIDGGGYLYTGGAHGSALYLPLTVARADGRLLEAAALFRSDADWPTALAQAARPLLCEEAPFADDPSLCDDDDFQQGTAATEANYALLLPGSDGIQVTFAQYQVGPYAIGDFRVTVPYAALREVLAPTLFPTHAAQP